MHPTGLAARYGRLKQSWRGGAVLPVPFAHGPGTTGTNLPASVTGA